MKNKDWIYYVAVLLFCSFCFSSWISGRLPPFSDASLHFYTLNHFKESVSQGIFPAWDKELGLGYPYLLFYHGVFYYYFFGFLSLLTGPSFAYNFGFFLSSLIGMLSCFLLLTKHFKCDKNVSLFVSSLFVLNYHVLMWLGVWMGSYAFFFAMSLIPLALLLFFETKTKKHLIFSIVLGILALSHLIVSALSFFLLLILLAFMFFEKKSRQELINKSLFLLFGFLIASCWYIPTFSGLLELGAETVRFDYGSESFDLSTYFMHFGYILFILCIPATVYFFKKPKKFKLPLLFSAVFFLTFVLILGFFKEFISLIPLSKFIQQAWRFSALHLLSGVVVSAVFLSELWNKYSRKIPKDYHEAFFLVLVFAVIGLNWGTIQTPSLFFADVPQIWQDSAQYMNSQYRTLTLPNTCGAFNVIQSGRYFSACNIEEHHVSLEVRTFKESIKYSDFFHENFTNLMKFTNVKYIEILAEFFIPYYEYGKLQENFDKFVALADYLSLNPKFQLVASLDYGKPPSRGFELQWNLDRMQLLVFEIKDSPLRYFFAENILPLGKNCDLKSWLLNTSLSLENSFWYYPSGDECVFQEQGSASLLNSALLKESPESFEFELDLKKEAYLIINENNFHGWHASLDNKDTEVLTASPGFIMVKIPSGQHSLLIKRQFSTASTAGLLISIASLIVLTLLYR